MNHKPFWPGRRQALAKISLIVASTFCTPFIWAGSRTTPRKIVIRDPGGIYIQIYGEILYKPFTQATGIQVIHVTSPTHPTAQIQSMVTSGAYLWDMAVLADFTVISLTNGQENFLEAHELEHDPFISSIPSQFVSSYGVGTNLYTSVMAYRTDKVKGAGNPQSWQDFWDIKRFEGRRSLCKIPSGVIEIALMADGVTPEKVYPCDLDRAFRSLDKIKPHIAVWWRDPPQPEQLLKNGEIDLIQAFVVRARAAQDAGLPVAFSWNQHIYSCASWAILKGTPKADLCRKFIQFAAHPRQQALLASAQHGMGPTHPDAFKYIDKVTAQRLPSYPTNLKKGLHINTQYWAKNQTAITEHFNEWMLR